MVMSPRSTIVGVFRDQAMAEQALNALTNAGFTREQIRYSGFDNTAGGASGSFFSDLKSLFTGQDTANPTNGNFTQDIADMGLSDEEAHYYENEYRSGHRVIAVKAPGREQEVMTLMQQYGAYNHTMRGANAGSVNTPNFAQQPAGYAQQPVAATAANANQVARQRDERNVPYQANQTQADADRAARRDQIAQEETVRENRETLRPGAQGVQAPQAQAMQSRAAQEQQVTATAANSDTQLQSMQAQLQSIQQQLRDTQMKLEATKQREAQLQATKQRDTHMHELQRQIQEAQAQLQASQQELKASQARVDQYGR